MIPALRPYQSEIVNNIRKVANTGVKRIVAVAPTGSGKTIIFCHIADQAAKKHNRVFILVHRQEILRQTLQKLAMFGLQPGVIQSGQKMTANYIQVAMIQTLVNRARYLGAAQPKLVIVDEFHHAVAPTYKKILHAFPNALSLGFTATPARTDGKGLDEMADAMVLGPTTASLVESGYLAIPVVLSSPMARQIFKTEGSIRNGEYDPDTETVIMGEKKIVNETVDMYGLYFKGSPAVIFCASLDDCETVAASMRATGWKCETVRGDMDDTLRQEYITGLGTGHYNAICSYDVLGEGVDVPILAGVILRRRTLSIIVYLQQVGRALRLAPGKTHALVIDQVGNTYFHGHPMAKRKWSLKGVEVLPGEVKTVECPNPLCRAILSGRPRVCPYCNTDLTKGGEGVQVTESPELVFDALRIIQPPEVGEGAIEAAEIFAYANGDREQALIEQTLEQVHHGQMGMAERFRAIMRYLGKSNTYTEKIYKEYIQPELERRRA